MNAAPSPPAASRPGVATARNQGLGPALEALAGRDVEAASSELSIVLVLGEPFEEARTLPLHVLALLELDRGGAEGARGLLVEAAAVERRAGCDRLALHTDHQLALVTQEGATVGSVGHYYEETYRTLAKMAQSEGMGACLKSIAELCLLRGRRVEALRMLERSSQLLRGPDPRASEHVLVWSRALGG